MTVDIDTESLEPEQFETVVFDPTLIEPGMLATSYSNGRLPKSALLSIGSGLYLERHAAAAWLALEARARQRYGNSIHVSDAYRVLGSPGDLGRGRWSQWAAWERYKRGGNLAAYPGTSNHGWGLAVDMATSQRYIMDAIGAPFGWAKKWSDAPSEAWHIRYKAGVWNGKIPHSDPVLRYRMAGPSVEKLKILLYDKGIRDFSSDKHGNPSSNRYNRFFGEFTKRAVQRFQRAHHLSADGVVGPSTWKALRS